MHSPSDAIGFGDDCRRCCWEIRSWLLYYYHSIEKSRIPLVLLSRYYWSHHMETATVHSLYFSQSYGESVRRHWPNNIGWWLTDWWIAGLSVLALILSISYTTSFCILLNKTTYCIHVWLPGLCWDTVCFDCHVLLCLWVIESTMSSWNCPKWYYHSTAFRLFLSETR